MHEALNKLIVKPDHILVDGCYFYDYYDSETIRYHIHVLKKVTLFIQV